MTYFLRDILRQPEELRRTFDFLSGPGAAALESAAGAIRNADHVYLTGIGSSWHAVLCAAPFFHRHGFPIVIQDSAEFLYSQIPRDSVVIVISRSGRSVEIVQVLEKFRNSGVTVIGITNAADGTLALEAQIPIIIPVAMDHAISVNTYITLAAAAAILASHVTDSFDATLAAELQNSIQAVDHSIPSWQSQLEGAAWLSPGKVFYFLARGSSLGSCQETRLLWEEGVKSPAAAMITGSFRHGPQEMLHEGARFGIWIDAEHSREQDLAVANDLRKLGASVMLVGQNLPADAADLVFHLPAIPAAWQFLIDIVPAQLAAEKISRLTGVDCDTFRYCSFIVEDEFGLMDGGANKAGK